MREFAIEMGRLGVSILAIVIAVFGILVIDSCAGGTYRDEESFLDLPSSEGIPTIRVRLEELTGSQNLSFHSKSNLDVFVDDDGSAWKTIKPGNYVHIRQNKGSITLNGEPVPELPLRVEPQKRLPVHTGKRRYLGTFRVYRHPDEGFEVVNHVAINAYLWSVVGSEMKLEWNMPCLRTQSVAARTYAVWEIKTKGGKGSRNHFDVFNTTASQAYRGVHKQGPRSVKAVRQTRGLILYYNNEVVPAFFHSTCGGMTTAASSAITHFPSPDPPPLQGGVRCKWDRISKYYSWKVRLTPEELQKELAPKANSKQVADLKVINRDRSKRVRSARLIFRDGSSKKFTGKEVRRGLRSKGVRSTLFKISRSSGEEFVIDGRGWGHGAGLCQMGAVGAGREGSHFEDILSHYYPGASIGYIYR